MPSDDEHFGNVFLNIQQDHREGGQSSLVYSNIAKVDHLIFTSPDISTSANHLEDSSLKENLPSI